MMAMDLSNAEIRVLGCLLEKQRTTPDHYPLSLNSLRLACNQATNREPVVNYDDAVIRDALHRLERRGFTRLAGASRAAKYRHLLSQALPMSDSEQAVMCVLMLRGPQTPGELKQRGERIHAFEDLEEVHATLAQLIERDLVARLQRRPGQKEERYSQLLGADSPADRDADSSTTARFDGERHDPAHTISPEPGLAERVADLEHELAELRAELIALREGTVGGHGEAEHSEEAGHGGAEHGEAGHGEAGHGGAEHGEAGHGEAGHGGAEHSEAEHGGTTNGRTGHDRIEGEPALVRDSHEIGGDRPRWRSEEIAQPNT